MAKKKTTKKKKVVKKKKITKKKTKIEKYLEKKSTFNEKEFYNQYKGLITCAYKKDVFVDKEGNTRCNAKRTQEREKYLLNGLTDDIVLIEVPKPMFVLEWELHDKKGEKKVTKEKLKEWLKQTCENAKAHKIDFCAASHGGTSDYFYACNFENLIENKEKECKKEIAKLIVPEEAIDFIDESNFGNTLVPIINRPHWKENKYKGAIHKIIEGKNPDKHKNKVPDIVLQRVFDNERPKFERVESYGDSDINSISLTKVISTTGLKKRGQEYQGSNVWHGSTTGLNFCINPSKNVWHCFRCDAGGGVAKAIALNKGIIKSCDENLSPTQFKEVLEIAREEHGLKKPEPKKEKKEQTISGRFIFDKSKIVKPVIFSCHKLSDNIFGYGFLLPKSIPVYSGKGDERKIIGKRQIRSPAVLTSDGELIEPTLETENNYKIRYIEIPYDLNLRLDLDIIQNQINNKNKIVNGLELFNKIKEKGYNKFLFFQNKKWYKIHALWDMGTYFFILFNTYPIFELRGLSGTAKSKVMKTSKLFSLNPTEIMVNPSEASLFRITHSKRPTKYIDEAERLFLYIGGQWQSSPIVELINGSYTKGSSVPRLEKIGNKYKNIYYQCYSPTMIGSIIGLRGATETRAITHIMTKASDKDSRGELEVEGYEENDEYQQIRNELYLFALQNWKRIEKEYKEIKIENLKKRDLQLWKPILTMAKVLDEKLFNEILDFAKEVSEQRKQDFIIEGSVNYKLLKILKENLERDNKNILLKEIARSYNINKEKPTSNKTISSNLDKLGFKEFRKHGREGSFLEINGEIYNIIVSPICPNLSFNISEEKEKEDLSSQSSQSSHLPINSNNNVMNSNNNVMNGDEQAKKGVTNVTQSDECDDNIAGKKLKKSKNEDFSEDFSK